MTDEIEKPRYLCCFVNKIQNKTIIVCIFQYVIGLRRFTMFACPPVGHHRIHLMYYLNGTFVHFS